MLGQSPVTAQSPCPAINAWAATPPEVNIFTSMSNPALLQKPFFRATMIGAVPCGVDPIRYKYFDFFGAATLVPKLTASNAIAIVPTRKFLYISPPCYGD